MKLIKLLRSLHGKSAWAIYAYPKYKIEVYLMHNHPCKGYWGKFKVICYVKPNSGLSEENTDRIVFTDYAEFRLFRANFKAYLQQKIDEQNSNTKN